MLEISDLSQGDILIADPKDINGVFQSAEFSVQTRIIIRR
jgi:hypothetical protein